MSAIQGKSKVTIDRRFRALLNRLPDDATREVKQTISQSGEVLRFAMLQRVPTRTGALAASIGIRTDRDGLVTFVGFDKRLFPRQWRKAGFRAHFTEFGTKGTAGGGIHKKGKGAGKVKRAHKATAAHPFVLPALRDEGPKIFELHEEAVRRALDKASQGAGSG